ncbi:MAG: FAD-binding protein [Coriobacteriales bacterium]|nr:FAD-binding protein [Coriobacteriales bacterium]
MSGLVVDVSKCRGCGRCVRACASQGIVIQQRLAQVTPNCIACGMCIDACPFDALSIVKDAVDTKSDANGVWVFAQYDSGALAAVTLELLGKARELADDSNTSLTALLAIDSEQECNEIAQKLIAHGADRVLICVDNRFANHTTNVFAAWICDMVNEYSPAILLIGATNFGRELAPCVAAQLRTGLTADCTVLAMDKETGLLHQTRPAFGGNLMATIMCPNHRPQMSTVRPGIFPPSEYCESRTGEIIHTKLRDSIEPNVTLLEKLPDDAGDSLLDDDTLVVVGRGIGSQKNLPLMQKFADLIHAGLGCSRPLVESGWLEYKHQVGQTGLAVAPKVLISIGVSGAIQHLAGIGSAETIIAINPDASAPIHSVATYSIKNDALEVVKELVEQLQP